MEYKKGMLFTSEKDNLQLIGILLPAIGLLIYSFIEKRRSKILKQENYNIETSELLEQQKFVVRKEVGIFQVITYFGLEGNTVGFLKEEYDFVIQSVWQAVLSFLLRDYISNNFIYIITQEKDCCVFKRIWEYATSIFFRIWMERKLGS